MGKQERRSSKILLPSPAAPIAFTLASNENITLTNTHKTEEASELFHGNLILDCAHETCRFGARCYATRSSPGKMARLLATASRLVSYSVGIGVCRRRRGRRRPNILRALSLCDYYSRLLNTMNANDTNRGSSSTVALCIRPARVKLVARPRAEQSYRFVCLSVCVSARTRNHWEPYGRGEERSFAKWICQEQEQITRIRAIARWIFHIARFHRTHTMEIGSDMGLAPPHQVGGHTRWGAEWKWWWSRASVMLNFTLHLSLVGWEIQWAKGADPPAPNAHVWEHTNGHEEDGNFDTALPV